MKVILTENIEALGNAGTVKEVANGYARNYLLPRGLAMPATADALKRLERQRAAIERRAANAANEARGMADRLGATTVYIYAKSGEQNRLYGSVTTADIAAALTEQHGVTIDRRNIALDEPIHRLGTYTANVKLAGGATGKLNLVVDNEANRGKPRPEAAAPVVEAAPVTEASTTEIAPAAEATYVAEAAPAAEATYVAEAAPAAEAVYMAEATPVAEAAPIADVSGSESAFTAEAADVVEAPTAEAAPISEAAPAEAAYAVEPSVSEIAPDAEVAAEVAPAAEASTAEAAPAAEAAPVAEATAAEAILTAEAAPIAEAADTAETAPVATMTGESVIIEPHPQVVVSNLETDHAASDADENGTTTTIATPIEEAAPITEAQANIEDELR